MTDANASMMTATMAAGTQDLNSIRINESLFKRMALPACFKQCSRTDIDIAFLNEVECTYKCMITYKDTLSMLQEK